MPGQNSEEAAELVATIRGEHVVMKNWFMGPTKEAGALREKYGPYPGLWKEVLNWPGWKEARKAYLQFVQVKESNGHSQTGSGSNGVPRKRRTRWGSSSESDNDRNNPNGAPNQSGPPPDAQPPSKRRSRWGRDSATSAPAPAPAPAPATSVAGHYGPASASTSTPSLKPLPGLGLPGMPTNLSPQQQNEFQRHQARLREVNEKLDNLDREAARVDALPRGHRDRSPSPPPVYGADGKRKNTRAVRWRQRYTSERQDILEKLMNLNPLTRQSGLFKRKRSKKIRIPVEEHPQYNFIGLIIGPRGKTQKELEAKTGCKIAIRGRGSVKEGARGRRDGKVMESDDEPLHVVITGDDQRSVDAATDMIEQMLVVIDDEKNVHKQQQLRELALLNGTLKDDEFCPICAEKGHRAFECPKRFAMNNRNKAPSLQVRCAICGDTSHPTRDCTQKPEQQANQKEMDSDYMSFMAELDGKKVEKVPPSAPPGGICPPADKNATPPGSLTKPPAGLPPPPSTPAGRPPPPGPGGPPPPPPPMSSLPPPPPPPPPPPAGAAGAAGGAGLPPPPPPPPPVGNTAPGSYYGNQQHQRAQQQQHQQQQQPYQNYQQGNNGYYNNHGNNGNSHYQKQYYGNQQQHQPSQQPQQHYQQQQPPPPQPPQQQQQQQYTYGGETQGWDYTSYYGAGGQGGDAGGAGGFNWWENS